MSLPDAALLPLEGGDRGGEGGDCLLELAVLGLDPSGQHQGGLLSLGGFFRFRLFVEEVDGWMGRWMNEGRVDVNGRKEEGGGGGKKKKEDVRTRAWTRALATSACHPAAAFAASACRAASEEECSVAAWVLLSCREERARWSSLTLSWRCCIGIGKVGGLVQKEEEEEECSSAAWVWDSSS